jgi:peptidoglycan-associated lipoprotein
MALKKSLTSNSLYAVLVVSSAALLSACSMRTASNDYDRFGNGETADGGIGLGTLQRVHFEYDSSVLSADASKVLKKHSKQLKANRKTKVLIEGHTDERGTSEYNIALGERRAKAALDHLVATGVERDQLEMKSWGEEKPLTTDSNKEALKINRRDEFVIIDK